MIHPGLLLPAHGTQSHFKNLCIARNTLQFSLGGLQDQAGRPWRGSFVVAMVIIDKRKYAKYQYLHHELHPNKTATYVCFRLGSVSPKIFGVLFLALPEMVYCSYLLYVGRWARLLVSFDVDE